MALSHFRNSTAARNKYEVVNPSLFEVHITLPSGVTPSVDSSNTGDILLEHVRSISGLDGLNPSIGTITQKFKFAERIYAGGPESTHLELGINFSLNLTDSNENYIYTTLRKWTNKIYNPATGSMGTKSQYTEGASMVIYEYNRDGSVWRRIECKDVFPTGQMTGMGDRNYDNVNEANELTINFICDLWGEKAVGLPSYE